MSQSVLHQQAKRNLKCECHLSSLQASYGTVGSQSSDEQISENEHKVANSSSSITSSISTLNNNYHHNQLHILKKQGVSGESCDASVIGHSSDILIRKYEKDFK
jgi:hypothetical protein